MSNDAFEKSTYPSAGRWNFDDSVNAVRHDLEDPLKDQEKVAKSMSFHVQTEQKTRSQSLRSAVKNAYQVLGVKPSNSRTTLHIQVRSAIGVALSTYYNTYEIGEALNRDRSSVSHYTTKHVQNLKHWKGYRRIYQTVRDEIDDVLQDHLLVLKIDALSSRIEKLKAIKQELIQILKEKNEAA